MEICVRDCTHRQPVDQHVLNFNNISYFDSMSYKEYFCYWILYLQDYNYVEILKDFKVCSLCQTSSRTTKQNYGMIQNI